MLRTLMACNPPSGPVEACADPPRSGCLRPLLTQSRARGHAPSAQASGRRPLPTLPLVSLVSPPHSCNSPETPSELRETAGEGNERRVIREREGKAVRRPGVCRLEVGQARGWSKGAWYSGALSPGTGSITCLRGLASRPDHTNGHPTG